jgi:hypothetical protein
MRWTDWLLKFLLATNHYAKGRLLPSTMFAEVALV